MTFWPGFFSYLHVSNEVASNESVQTGFWLCALCKYEDHSTAVSMYSVCNFDD